jgi:hypothetical protein
VTSASLGLVLNVKIYWKNAPLHFLWLVHLFIYLFIFYMSTQEEGRGIRTSNLHFIRRGLSRLSYLLGTPVSAFRWVVLSKNFNIKKNLDNTTLLNILTEGSGENLVSDILGLVMSSQRFSL